MKITYSIKEPEVSAGKRLTRVAIYLEVGFSAQIEDTFSFPERVITSMPIPVTLYQHPDDTITLATHRVVDMNGKKIQVKAFRLRLAPIYSFTKTPKPQLLLHFPGKMLLGYVEKHELAKAEAWLKALVEEAKGLITTYIKNRDEAAADINPVTVEVSNEIEGVESHAATSSRLLPD